MKRIAALMLLSAPTLFGADSPDVESLKRELRELRERTEQLERKLQAFETASSVTNAPPPASSTPGQVSALVTG